MTEKHSSWFSGVVVAHVCREAVQNCREIVLFLGVAMNVRRDVRLRFCWEVTQKLWGNNKKKKKNSYNVTRVRLKGALRPCLFRLRSSGESYGNVDQNETSKDEACTNEVPHTERFPTINDVQKDRQRHGQ